MKWAQEYCVLVKNDWKKPGKEAYPPKKEEIYPNFCIFTQSFALLIGLYWPLKVTPELKMHTLYSINWTTSGKYPLTKKSLVVKLGHSCVIHYFSYLSPSCDLCKSGLDPVNCKSRCSNKNGPLGFFNVSIMQKWMCYVYHNITTLYYVTWSWDVIYITIAPQCML